MTYQCFNAKLIYEEAKTVMALSFEVTDSQKIIIELLLETHDNNFDPVGFVRDALEKGRELLQLYESALFTKGKIAGRHRTGLVKLFDAYLTDLILLHHFLINQNPNRPDESKFERTFRNNRISLQANVQQEQNANIIELKDELYSIFETFRKFLYVFLEKKHQDKKSTQKNISILGACRIYR